MPYLWLFRSDECGAYPNEEDANNNLHACLQSIVEGLCKEDGRCAHIIMPCDE